MIVPRVHHDRISSVGNGRLCDYFLGAGYVNVFCESIYSWIGTFSSFSRIDIAVCPQIAFGVLLIRLCFSDVRLSPDVGFGFLI